MWREILFENYVSCHQLDRYEYMIIWSIYILELIMIISLLQGWNSHFAPLFLFCHNGRSSLGQTIADCPNIWNVQEEGHVLPLYWLYLGPLKLKSEYGLPSSFFSFLFLISRALQEFQPLMKQCLKSSGN